MFLSERPLATTVDAVGQQSESFVEPPREQIPAISAMHVEAMEKTDDDAVWVAAGMRHVILHTVGRRTGAVHKVALPYWVDDNGHRIVVASFAGGPRDPAWFLNLCDRAANPDVEVRVQGGTYRTVPEVLDGTDYDDTWAKLTADRPHYLNYQSRTDRRIPLVRLAERQ